MRVCSICKRCYDDSVVFCTEKSHRSLSKTRDGSTEMIAGYRFEFQLDSAGSGEVYSAREKASGQPCIVRLPGSDDKNLSQFVEESTTAAGFFHTNVVSIYELGNLASGEPYMVFEAPEGQSLQKHLEEVGAPSLLTAVQVARQTAEALYALHLNGLTHRALNPANIILTSEADRRLVVKLQNIDFGGLVQQSIASHKILDDSGLYTLRYFAPEQCAGEKAVPKTDIYALGVIFYEMLAGAPPFEGRTAAALIHAHRNQQPPEIKIDNYELRMLLTHCLSEALQKRAASRQSSANAFARQLRHIEQLKTHMATPPPAGFDLPGSGPAAGVAPAKQTAPVYEKGEKPVATKVERESFEPVLETAPPQAESEPDPPKPEHRPNPTLKKIDPEAVLDMPVAELEIRNADFLVPNSLTPPEALNGEILVCDSSPMVSLEPQQVAAPEMENDSTPIVKKVDIDSVVVDIDEQLGIPRQPDREPMAARIKHTLFSMFKTREEEPPPASLHADLEPISDLELEEDLPDIPDYLSVSVAVENIKQEMETMTAPLPTPGILARSSVDPGSLKRVLPKVDPAEVARTIAELEKKSAARVPVKIAWETPDDDIPSEAQVLKVRGVEEPVHVDSPEPEKIEVLSEPVCIEQPLDDTIVPVVEFEAPHPDVLELAVMEQPISRPVSNISVPVMTSLEFEALEDDILFEADMLEVLAREQPNVSIEDLPAAPSLAELLTDADHQPVVSSVTAHAAAAVDILEAEWSEEMEAEIIMARSVDVIEPEVLVLEPIEAQTHTDEVETVIEAKSADVVETREEIIQAGSADVVEPQPVESIHTSPAEEPEDTEWQAPAELSEPEAEVNAVSALLDALPLPVIDLKNPDDAAPEITHLSFDGSSVEKLEHGDNVSHAQRRSRLKVLKRKLRSKTPVKAPEPPQPRPLPDASPIEAKPIEVEPAAEKTAVPTDQPNIAHVFAALSAAKPAETPVIRSKRKKRADAPARVEWRQSREEIPSKAEVLEVLLKDDQAELKEKPAEAPVFRAKRKKARAALPEPKKIKRRQPVKDIPSGAEVVEVLAMEPVNDLPAITRRELPSIQASVPLVPIKPTRIEFADPEEITLVRSNPIRVNWEAPWPQDLYLYEDSAPRSLDAGFFPTILGGRDKHQTIDLHPTNSVFAAYAESGGHRRIPYRAMMVSGGFMILLLALAFGNDSIRMYVQNLTLGDPIAAKKSPPVSPPVRPTTTTTTGTTSTTVDILQPSPGKKKTAKTSDNKPSVTDDGSDKSKTDSDKDRDLSQPMVTRTVIGTPVVRTTKVIYSENGKVRSRTVPDDVSSADRATYPTRPRIVKQPTR